MKSERGGRRQNKWILSPSRKTINIDIHLFSYQTNSDKRSAHLFNSFTLFSTKASSVLRCFFNVICSIFFIIKFSFHWASLSRNLVFLLWFFRASFFSRLLSMVSCCCVFVLSSMGYLRESKVFWLVRAGSHRLAQVRCHDQALNHSFV